MISQYVGMELMILQEQNGVNKTLQRVFIIVIIGFEYEYANEGMSVRQLITFDLLVLINFKSFVLAKISVPVLCLFSLLCPVTAALKTSFL